MPIIKTVKGDLLDLFEEGAFDGIAHGCNCFHTMGSGIAPQIKNRFPGAYEADVTQTIKGDPSKLGSYSAYIDDDFKVIFNLYTQYFPGPNVDYEAIENAFLMLDTVMWQYDKECDFEIPRYMLGIPKIGAGIAGGDWEKISEIINRVTPNIDITLVEWDKQHG